MVEREVERTVVERDAGPRSGPGAGLLLGIVAVIAVVILAFVVLGGDDDSDGGDGGIVPTELDADVDVNLPGSDESGDQGGE